MIVNSHLGQRLPRWSSALIAVAIAILILIPIRQSNVIAQPEPPVVGINIIPQQVVQDTEIADPSWRLLQLVHPAHRQGIWHLAFSPDGTTIASASWDRTTRLWDVATGRLRETIERPINCKCVAFSPDGRRLAIAGGDSGIDPPGELVLWDLTRGEVEAELLDRRTAKYICSTAFSPDGRWLVAGGTDTTVTIWNVAQHKRQRTLHGHSKMVSSVAFSPDGTQVVSASFDHSIRVWDPDNGEEMAVLEGHEAEVRHVAFSPDGRLLLSTSDDKTARIWDATNYEQLMVMDGHQGFVLCGSFAPDGRHLVTAGKTGDGQRVLFRDLATGGYDARLFPRQTTEIMSVVFSKDGSMLAIAGGFDNFQIWKRTDDRP